MSLTKFNGEANNIQSLPDKPTQTASQLKTLFDKIGTDIKNYLNSTLTSELDTALGNKADSSSVYSKADVYNKTETYSKTEVDTALGNKASTSNVYGKGDFKVLTGSLTPSGNGYAYLNLNYPSGCNSSNSVVISAMATPLDNDADYEYGEVVAVTGLATKVNPYVKLTSSKVIVGAFNNTGSTKTINYKVVLMKIS